MNLVSGLVSAHSAGPVGWLVWDNPSKLNALSPGMSEDALAVITAYAADPAIKVVVMRGGGTRAFISGGDIKSFETTRANAEVARANRAIPARLRRDSSQAALIATRPISTLTVCFRNVLAPLPPELDQAPVLDLCLWSLLGRKGKGKYLGDIEPAAYRVHEGGVFSTQGARNQYLMTAQSQLVLARIYARLGERGRSHRLLFEASLTAVQWLSFPAALALTLTAPVWWLAQRGLQLGRAVSSRLTDSS